MTTDPQVSRRRRLRGLVVGAVLVALVAAVVVVVLVLRREPDPCGPEIRKSDGTAWTCTFADDFDGDRLDPERWLAQKTSDSDYTVGGDCYLGDDPDNVEVADGVLRLTAVREKEPLVCRGRAGEFTTPVSAGMVTTHGRFAQAYGRFEIRAKMPRVEVPGAHSALWLFPQDQTYGAWPASGEIDVAELFSAYPDRAIPRLHYPTTAAEDGLTATDCVVKEPWRFHTYTAVWTRRGITVSYDGEECFRTTWQPTAPLTGSQPFDQPFIVALTQGIGVPGTANAYVDGTTPLPATLEVDYVRVWR